jgi:hypothetical protein
VKSIIAFFVISAALLAAALACQRGTQEQGFCIVGALLVVNLGMMWKVTRN